MNTAVVTSAISSRIVAYLLLIGSVFLNKHGNNVRHPTAKIRNKYGNAIHRRFNRKRILVPPRVRAFYTMRLRKNATVLPCYNFGNHESIFIILAEVLLRH